MQVLESEIERKCKTIAEKHECILLKVEKRKGWPDRILLAPNGQMSWIEFKRPGEDPTTFQKEIHQQLVKMNFRVYVVENYSQFMGTILLLKALDLPNGSPSIIR